MMHDSGPWLDGALAFMRLMVGLVFLSSGWAHLRNPAARSKSIEMPVWFTAFLGAAELSGGFAVIVGIFARPASLGLILIMLGAIQKKAFVWKTGFWGRDGLGWNYELILSSMLSVVLFSGGGGLKLFGF
jgi:putative oxidoreductase